MGIRSRASLSVLSAPLSSLLTCRAGDESVETEAFRYEDDRSCSTLRKHGNGKSAYPKTCGLRESSNATTIRSCRLFTKPSPFLSCVDVSSWSCLDCALIHECHAGEPAARSVEFGRDFSHVRRSCRALVRHLFLSMLSASLTSRIQLVTMPVPSKRRSAPRILPRRVFRRLFLYRR